MNVNPAFREFVQAFTSGTVSTRTTIKIRLTEDVADSASVGKKADESLFTIRPGIKGSATWIDARTIAFRPDEPLPQDKVYTVDFALSKVMTVPDSLKLLKFQFRTMKQVIQAEVINHTAVSNSDLSREFLTGILYSADEAEDAAMEQALTATQDGRALPVTWTHDHKKNESRFRLDSIRREKSPGTVRIKWNGKGVGAENSGEINVEIPALGDFRMMRTTNATAEEPCINIYFSDPLDGERNLDGLFRVGNFHNLRYEIEQNILRVYLPETSEKKLRLTLEPSIRNIRQATLGRQVTADVILEDLRPNVRFVGDGVIMPTSNGMLLPFEAVNLNAVDIKVVRIYEKNILQFLQVNDLPGNSELVRVGRIVLKKTVPLNGAPVKGNWNRYSIDLSTLMKTEPGAIYSVILNFKKEYSTYPCTGAPEADEKDAGIIRQGDPEKENEQGWGYYSNYMDDDYRDGGWQNFRWEERQNPCKSSYYFNKSVSRNVLASDLGIIAKCGTDDKWNIFVTDLVSGQPLEGVDLTLFNFQSEPIARGRTDNMGMVVIPLKKVPFVVVAKYKDQTGYLKLSEGKTLSLSMFDVSGEPVQTGLKGFIYGERGVWRPGDSIFLSFILEDKTGQLPKSHPVVFTLMNPSGQQIQRIVKTTSLNGVGCTHRQLDGKGNRRECRIQEITENRNRKAKPAEDPV